MDQIQQPPQVPATPAQPVQQPVVQEEPKKKSGWLKWTIIILAILIVVAGIGWFFTSF